MKMKFLLSVKKGTVCPGIFMQVTVHSEKHKLDIIQLFRPQDRSLVIYQSSSPGWAAWRSGCGCIDHP